MSQWKNVGDEPLTFRDRFKQRLEATKNGLRELETLRNKHRMMISQVKNRIGSTITEGSEDVSGFLCKSLCLFAIDVFKEILKKLFARNKLNVNFENLPLLNE